MIKSDEHQKEEKNRERETGQRPNWERGKGNEKEKK